MRAITALLIAGGFWIPLASTFQQAGRVSSGGIEESIYIARSLRTSRITPTAYCDQQRIGFKGTFEDQYTFQSVATQPADGRVTNPNVNTVGRLHGCVGSSDPAVLNFYAEGLLGAVSFKMAGSCRTATGADFPEPGITEYACLFVLRDLPEGYVVGTLTTNTIVSREAIGERSDPYGYVQPSIATIRLWKRRSAAH